MAVIWTGGAVFGLCFLVFFVPICISGIILFWLRRGIQPIKARQPYLVLVTDVVLLFYVVLLCVQRIIAPEYPCVITLWSGYIGTIVLFDTYLWRCWTLYFKFHLTRQKLLNLPASDAPFFIRNQHLQNGWFLSKLASITFIVMLIPVAVLTGVSSTIRNTRGDGCNRGFSDPLLAAYVAVYIALFSFFAVTLRTVDDNFRIKEELKITGMIALAAVIPWVIFNNSLGSFNSNTFPISTLFLLLAAATVFAASTLWPVYRSIWQPPMLLDIIEIPTNLNSLSGIIAVPQGLEAFQQFLIKEFSVENLLFYQEIEAFRELKLEAENSASPDGPLQVLGEAQRIYAKYIITGAPFQVNLPDPIVRALEQRLKLEFSTAGKAKASTPTISHTHVVPFIPDEPHANIHASLLDKDGNKQKTETLFDAAQHNIFHLMDSDSVPRFVRTEAYAALVRSLQSIQHKKQVLTEMEII